MSVEARLTFALAVAASAAYLLTPVAIRTAGHFDFFDKPKGYKGHAKPIPYLGGAAVLLAFAVTVIVLAGDAGRTVPLLSAVGVLWVVGTVDDRRHLSPGLRVLVEIAVASVLWASDLGWSLGSGGAVDLVATVLWVLAVVNAFNLFDNMDGASSVMAAVVSGAVAAVGIGFSDPWLTVVGAALAGSCLGFLPFNLARPQAKIFLGDGGSMPIGLAVAIIVMAGASGAASGWMSLAAGLLLVGVPAVDTALVIVSRRRKGISVLTGGRDHLTHRARRRLGTAHAVALTLGALQAVVASVAIVALNVGPFAIISATVVVLAIAGAAITMLEREEDRLLAGGDVSVPPEALEHARERRARRPGRPTVGDATLVLFALGAALSPFAFGYYASSSWVPIGLGLVLVAAMGSIRRPQRLPAQAWAGLVGLSGIGLLALASSSWADSGDQAVVTANRWLVIAAALGLSLVLARSTRRDVLAVATLGAGTAAVGVYVVARMLVGDGSTLFLTGRLHEPLGYINAEATVFIMGVWLALAAASSRRAWLAGVGMAAATGFASLALLSQSRGAALAAVASTVVVLIAVPGRQRRAMMLLLVAAGVAFAAPALLEVYDASRTTAGVPAEAVVRRAAIFLAVTAGATGLFWGAAVAIFGRLPQADAVSAVRAGRVLLAGIGIIGALGLLASGSRITNALDERWTAFTTVQQGPTPTAEAGSRLVSGSGNRYDYWQVAWNAFQREPVRGIGAGNFDRVWFANRTVSEDVRQPHSIEFQVLSELGLAGGAFLMLMLAGFAAAIVRVHRSVRSDPATAGIAVAAVGVPLAWLVHTSVDWQHLLPGTTAVALLMLAVLLRQPDRVRPEPSSAAAASETPEAAASETPPRPRRGAVFASALVIALAVATTGATLTRQAFADHYRDEAFAVVTTDPAQAIVEADRSLRLNAGAVRSYYVKAAALARQGRGADAAAVLRDAAIQDKTNPVTWALRGDLATRMGREAAARRFYRRALALNPRDPGLQALVAPAPPVAVPAPEAPAPTTSIPAPTTPAGTTPATTPPATTPPAAQTTP